MLEFLIRIYEYLKNHRIICRLSFLFITLILSFLLVNQTYKEDISDFLPLNNKYNKALKVYQDISGANRLFAIVQYSDSTLSDPDSLVKAVELFADKLMKDQETKAIRNLTYQIDAGQVSELLAYVYRSIPYFLSADDYDRIDSLLNHSDYVSSQIANDKQMLMFPVSSLLSENLQKDPLNLFTPVVAQLQKNQPGVEYENYDGYIFSPDMKRAIMMMETPYGASETEQNGLLINQLEKCAEQVTDVMPFVDIHFTGGPVIAVGNAKQIKTDSFISICIAVVLIVSFLFFVFRNMWNLLLIVLSIGWGWLFAMGTLALIHDSVSVIVIGISSVILGIAVNYPLHLIAHLQHTPDVRSALKEIAPPLVVGNITTVGAFLALVPLESVALRDLGLFSSMLLVGTIVFVLIYLPHVLKTNQKRNETALVRLGNYTVENKRFIVYGVVILTFIFAYCGLYTEFDSNMGHINYMSKEQKEDMAYFQSMMTTHSATQKVYVINPSDNLDAALDNSQKLIPLIKELEESGDITGSQSCNQFVCSREEQKRRLSYWNMFVSKHQTDIEQKIRTAVKAEGFQADVFDDFFNILNAEYELKSDTFFAPIVSTVFASSIAVDETSQTYNVVDVLYTDKNNVDVIIEKVEQECPECYAFDVQTMNSSIATRLSDDFNYIGWACGLIVFSFLWFSLGSIELAMLSFLPMAISWVWILGIMAILGLQFNVVNIILATFIFGQGDDYTIFMTEGCQYEYAYRRKMLASYKNSIIVSATIMFIGIGSLILAKHPALHSLAEVTIVGMFSVVLMACLFPPLIYKWLVSKKGQYRVRPISLKPLFVTGYGAVVFICQLFSAYVLGFFLFVLCRPNRKSKQVFRNYARKCFWFDMNHIWGVHFSFENPAREDFSRPAVAVCNHQSMLDPAFLMAISPKVAIVANTHASNHLLTKKIFDWMDFYSIPEGEAFDDLRLLKLVNAGYTVVFFPEGERNAASSILRFHKGAFYFAEKHNLDIIPVFLHGANQVFPRNTLCTYSGTVTLRIEERIEHGDKKWGSNYVEQTKLFRQHFIQKYGLLKKQNETASYYSLFVKDRYRFKGAGIYASVRKNLSQYGNYSQWVDGAECPLTIIINSQWGELPLLLALVNPQIAIIAVEKDEEQLCVARYAGEGVADNITYYTEITHDCLETLKLQYGSIRVILQRPDAADIADYGKYKPIIIK